MVQHVGHQTTIWQTHVRAKSSKSSSGSTGRLCFATKLSKSSREMNFFGSFAGRDLECARFVRVIALDADPARDSTALALGTPGVGGPCRPRPACAATQRIFSTYGDVLTTLQLFHTISDMASTARFIASNSVRNWYKRDVQLGRNW